MKISKVHDFGEIVLLLEAVNVAYEFRLCIFFPFRMDNGIYVARHVVYSSSERYVQRPWQGREKCNKFTIRCSIYSRYAPFYNWGCSSSGEN